MNQRIVDLPGFDESLRLLVERERYSLRDIGMMFGVSFQCVQQWIVARGIEYPPETPRGTYALRVWDDRRHRFHPVQRGDFLSRRARREKATQRAERVVSRRRRQVEIAARLMVLRNDLGRDPTWREMWIALGGDPNCKYATCAARVLNKWDSHGRSMREKLADFRAVTGLAARPRGGAGHVSPRRQHLAAAGVAGEGE